MRLGAQGKGIPPHACAGPDDCKGSQCTWMCGDSPNKRATATTARQARQTSGTQNGACAMIALPRTVFMSLSLHTGVLAHARGQRTRRVPAHDGMWLGNTLANGPREPSRELSSLRAFHC